MTRWTEQVKRISNYDQLRESLSSSMGTTSAYSSNLNYVLQYWDTLTGLPFVHSIYRSIEPALDELATFDLRDIVGRLLAYAQELVDGQTNMGKYLPKVGFLTVRRFSLLFSSQVTYYKPSAGEVEIQLPLPVRANSLGELANQLEPEVVRRYFETVRERFVEIVAADGPIRNDLWQATGARTKQINDFDWNTAKNDLAPAHTGKIIVKNNNLNLIFNLSYRNHNWCR
jgi:hypothetical protein